jgi:trehalose 6-phosphate synthase
MLRPIILRFAVPIALGASLVSYFGLPYVEALLTRWFQADVQQRAQLVMTSMQDTLSDLVDRRDIPRIRAYLSRMVADAELVAVMVCKPDGSRLYRTDRTPYDVTCTKNAGTPGTREIVQLSSGPAQISRFALQTSQAEPYTVLILHDLSFVDRRQSTARGYLLAFAAISALTLASLAVLAVWLLLKRWAKVLVSDISSRRFLDDAQSPRISMPILSQVREVLQQIEETQRLEIDFRENWTPHALKQVVQEHLRSPEMIVVSNRQPYSHSKGDDGKIRVTMPASGMVTALEPVMRACSGTWVAHGSGPADREVVDRQDRIRVPPEDPAYALRRVWLSEAEEEGHYYGFSNEGLWPLCHLAYVRPAFRESDWKMYEAVNRKFADVVQLESQSKRPVVLIQDYHFALLPQLVRERVPQATIALFWHIPWPSAETFGVCPWKREMLVHMLGADILGFHTRYHCQNFLATVDRFVECQIDHEHMTVTLQGHVCHVVPYPISIEWPPRFLPKLPGVEESRDEVRGQYGIGAQVKLGLGVERWDFTKGILERFLALETLLEKHPQNRGKVTLLQIAAPSRSKLPAYRALQDQTLSEVARINEKFGTQMWKPIVLIHEHQDAERVFELYRAADFCLVNSLHDGMNLVAKEFVAARDDEDGVLILSTFAGASRELVEALLVNPFDVSETAAAIQTALNMPRDERRERMRLMRWTVKENNVYRWAGHMLMDAARIRQRQSLRAKPEQRLASATE